MERLGICICDQSTSFQPLVEPYNTARETKAAVQILVNKDYKSCEERMQGDGDEDGPMDGPFDEAENEWPPRLGVTTISIACMIDISDLRGLFLAAFLRGYVGLRWWCGLLLAPILGSAIVADYPSQTLRPSQ